MQHGDTSLGPQSPQLIFEFAGFGKRFVDHRLDDRLSERRELAAPETAKKSLHTGKSDAIDLHGLFVEHSHSGIVKD